MTDIVEWLRETDGTGITVVDCEYLYIAADEIEKLREERNRLREAIQKILDGIYIAKHYANAALKEKE